MREKIREAVWGEKRRSFLRDNRWGLAILLMCLVMAGVLVGGCWTYTISYRDKLMENQQQELLKLAEMVSRTIRLDLRSYSGDLRYAVQLRQDAQEQGSTIWEGDSSYARACRTFLQANRDNVCDIVQEDAKGKVVHALTGEKLTDPVRLSVYSEGVELYQYSVGEKHRLVLRQALEDGGFLCLVIDEDRYYRQLIQDIQIGRDGYIVVKNSKNVMLMHPDPGQWGMEILSGRQKRYGAVDLDSLEAMLKKQNEGEAGVSDYYSYWWLDPELPRVHKISAYAPVKLGEDFWIVSAVVNYDDLYLPIQKGLRGIIVMAVMIFVLFSLAIVCIVRLIWSNSRQAREVSYLRDLTGTLEQVHRSEEHLAHQQRLQIMGTMTGGIAHEFNNFLTPIMGHAELLMMSLPEDSDEYDSAREIMEASEKARDVVRQMSSLSRKNVETVYRSLEAKKLVSRVFHMIESVCPEERVELIQKNDLQDEQILGNATQINQVILNIAVNAVQAIGKGPGHLRVSARVLTREQILWQEMPADSLWQRHVVISLVDDGCGMSPATMRSIFDPFFTTKKAGEGTGLGLSLAQQIIAEHRGFIHVDSKPGEGSAFHVCLPVVPAEKAAAAQTVSARSLLIVDDNHKVLNLLETGFAENTGIRVRTADSAESFGAALREEMPGAVILDESVDGQEAVDLLMSVLGERPQVIRIVMARVLTRELFEARHRGIIDACIEKPVSEKEILDAIERIEQEKRHAGQES